MPRRTRVVAGFFGALCVLFAAVSGAAWAGFTKASTASGSVSTATLAAPTSLGASVSGGTVTLTWTATSSAWATGTRVLRSITSGSGYAQITQIAGIGTTTYADNPGNGTFYYVVQAYYTGKGANWNSANSSQASATVVPISLVQTTNGGGVAGSMAATFATTPVAGHLLVAIASTRTNGTMTTPAGWSVAISEAGTAQPDQTVFYKIAGAAEPTLVTVVTTATGNGTGIHIYEFAGVATLLTTGSSTGSSASVTSGSVVTTTARALILAGVATKSGTSFSAWTSSFVEANDFTGGSAGAKTLYGGATLFVNATGTYSTTATASTSGVFRGQIVAFK